MSEPTQEQINAEIAELKRIRPLIPQYTAFGDNNWDKVDAQIEVLENALSDIDIDNRTQADEDDDDESKWSLEVAGNAREACDWMFGDSDEKPSENWASLVGAKPKFDFRGVSPDEALAAVRAEEAVSPPKPKRVPKRTTVKHPKHSKKGKK